MLSHLILLLFLSPQVQASSTDARISDSTTKYFNDNVKSCKNYEVIKVIADKYIDGVKSEINSSKKLNSYLTDQRKFYMKSMFECDDKFVQSFSEKLAEDNREYHIEQRALLIKEIAEFEKRGLTGVSVITQYNDYAAKNDIDLPPDPEVKAILETKKAQIEKRRESCTDVMNLKKPLSLNEPRNQEGIGWCYAYTAADLVSNLSGEKVSAIHAAGSFNNLIISRIRRLDEGGQSDAAANAMIKNGLCLEKDMPSNDYAFIDRQNDIGTLYKNVNELGEIYSDKKEIASMNDKRPVTYKNKYTTQQVYVDLCTQQTETLIQISQVFPNLTLDQLTKILMESGKRSFNQLTQKCNLVQSDLMKGVVFKSLYEPKKPERLYSKIDEQLNKGQIVGIGYTAEVLLDYKAENMKGFHASTLIGRRFNKKTNSCEYLLRNSWGKNCSQYGNNIECKNGHAWVAEEIFKYNNAIYEVNYAENK